MMTLTNKNQDVVYKRKTVWRARKSSQSTKFMLLFVAAVLASGGCSATCELEVDKLSGITKEATRGSFREEWGASYSAASDCDSYGESSIIVSLTDNVKSLVEVSDYMKMDKWEQIPERETGPYNSDFVLKKQFKDQVLVAAIRNFPSGEGKEELGIEVFAGD